MSFTPGRLEKKCQLKSCFKWNITFRVLGSVGCHHSASQYIKILYTSLEITPICICLSSKTDDVMQGLGELTVNRAP